MSRLFKWGVIIALLILVASGLMAVHIIFVEDSAVEVPSIIGMSAVEAADRLQAVGLASRIDIVESDMPEGVVVSQTPGLGEKIGKGRTVVVRVSKGGAVLQMPDVRGMEFADAVRKLDAAGFKTGNTLRVSDPLHPSGVVIAQSPSAPARVPADRMVELLISEGAEGRVETVLVPVLKGQTESLARQILEQSGLSISRVINVDSDQVPEGTVLRTQPASGARVPNGNAVTLYIARAVAPTSVESPAMQPPSSPAAPVQPTPAPTETAPQQPPAVTQPQSVNVPQPTPSAPQTQPAGSVPSTPAKTARIRYQIPPLTRPMPFKITIEDVRGTRVLRDTQASGGEYITMDIGYTGEATVTVMLDGRTVWQEKYR